MSIATPTASTRAAHAGSAPPVPGDVPSRAMRALAAAEWSGSAFRIFSLLTTPAFFLHTTRVRVLFAFMIVLNAVTLVLSLRRRGPFTWGRRGVAFEVAESIGSMVLVAAFLPVRTFEGRLPYALPMANYLCPLAILLAIYRRAARRRGVAWRAMASDLALIALLVPLLAALALINGYRWAELRWANLASQAAPTMVALVVGYGLWRVVRDFADAEIEAADAQNEAFSAWLHSELLGYLASLRRQFNNPTIDAAELQAGLDDLEGAIRSAQHTLTLEQDAVALADVVSHQVRRFRSVIEIDSPGMLGGWRIDTPTARHLDRLLGDLLSNTLQSGATLVHITIDRQGGEYLIAVTDNGPGLPDDALSRPETSLGRLARSTADLGGSLEGERLPSGRGTRMTARLPNTHR